MNKIKTPEKVYKRDATISLQLVNVIKMFDSCSMLRSGPPVARWHGVEDLVQYLKSAM